MTSLAANHGTLPPQATAVPITPANGQGLDQLLNCTDPELDGFSCSLFQPTGFTQEGVEDELDQESPETVPPPQAMEHTAAFADVFAMAIAAEKDANQGAGPDNMDIQCVANKIALEEEEEEEEEFWSMLLLGGSTKTFRNASRPARRRS